jgi:hypothetical protein
MKRLSFLLVFVAVACGRSSEPGLNEVEFNALAANWSSCREAYTAKQTSFALLGTWRLFAMSCGECNRAGMWRATEAVELIFTDRQRVRLVRDGQLVEEANYTLRESAYGSVHVDTKAQSIQSYVRGSVEFCQSAVAFRGDHTDGTATYFSR